MGKIGESMARILDKIHKAHLKTSKFSDECGVCHINSRGRAQEANRPPKEIKPGH